MSVAVPPYLGGPVTAPSDIPPIFTVKPTGKPPYPMVLLAGVQKCGKSIAAAEFSASDLIGRTFWIEIGEGDANHYGSLPGARYEIVPHDGSYRSIGNAAWAASKQPWTDGKPNVIVIDNVTLLWEMLTAEHQAIANRRKKNPDAEATITMDLWNSAKKRWGDFLDILRAHNGPVILIARLEYVTIVDAAGNPTKEKDWKIRAEKNLPFEVDVIVTMPAYRAFEVSGVRSLRLQIPPGEKHKVPDFTLDLLSRKLGLDEAGATLPRVYIPPRPDPAEALAAIGDGQPQPRGSARLESTGPVDDEWSTPQPDRAGPEQQEQMWEAFNAAGLFKPDDRRRFVSEVLGFPVISGADLTTAQAQTVIDHLSGPAEDQAAPSPANGSGDSAAPPTIPALEDLEPEEPSARPGTENFPDSLAKATNALAVVRVEKRIWEAYNSSFINAAMYVDLVLAAERRRGELGVPSIVPNAVLAALSVILDRAREHTRSRDDIGRIWALIKKYRDVLVEPEDADALLDAARLLYADVVTGGQARPAA